MPRASQVTQVPVAGTLLPVLTAPAVSPNGDVVDAGAHNYLIVDNASGGSITVTVTATATQDGLAVSNLVVPVAAATRRHIGPLHGRTFGQTSGVDAGRVYVDYSAVASVTRGVVAL